MALDVKISRPLDNNYVQVDVSSKKMPTRYYKVPQNKADSFCTNFKKNDKKMSWRSNTNLVLFTLFGCLASSLFTKKLGTPARLAITTGAGVVGGIGSIYCTSRIMEKNYSNLLKSHNAEEILYEDKKLPI